MASAVIRVNEMLDVISREASEMAEAKSTAIKKEAEVLESILNKLLGGMLNLEGDRLNLIDLTQEIPMGVSRGTKASSQLSLSLDKAILVHRTDVSQWDKMSETCYVYVDEQNISCEEAIKTFGLEAICESLIDQLRNRLAPGIQISKFQERIAGADRLLAATQKDEGGEKIGNIEA